MPSSKLISPDRDRTRISIGLLFLSWQEFPESLLWVMLFRTVVFLPPLPDSGVPPPVYGILFVVLGVMLILCNGQCPQLILA
jgi:hypothetical protein